VKFPLFRKEFKNEPAISLAGKPQNVEQGMPNAEGENKMK